MGILSELFSNVNQTLDGRKEKWPLSLGLFFWRDRPELNFNSTFKMHQWVHGMRTRVENFRCVR